MADCQQPGNQQFLYGKKKKSLLFRGIKDGQVEIPSDSTLLTALGGLMSLYDTRSAEVFFHFL